MMCGGLEYEASFLRKLPYIQLYDVSNLDKRRLNYDSLIR